MTDPICSVPSGLYSPNDDLEMSELYFAYGSDLLPDVLKSRGGRPEVVTTAKLPRHRLAFFGYTEIWDGGWETVIESPEVDTWGVLYRMGNLDWERLDAWMGARLDGNGMYFHYPVTVTDSHGLNRYVRLYKKDVMGLETLPSTSCLEMVIRGAEHHALPQTYLDQLRRILARKSIHHVPLTGNVQRGQFVESDCRSCDTGVDREPPLIQLKRAVR